MTVENPTQARIRLRPETRRKWAAIRKVRRWTYTEAADALADDFIERYGIPCLPEGESETGNVESVDQQNGR